MDESVRTAVGPDRPITVGVLAPLSPPGRVEAGRHLLAGIEAAATDVNDAGGIGGRPLDLLVRDTVADPVEAEAAVDDLAARHTVAIVGEYHSVVARAAADRSDALGVPFLCSSAVLDALVDRPTDRVARLAPVQSRGGVAIRSDTTIMTSADLCCELVDLGATAALLLVGHPEPAIPSSGRSGPIRD